jgi:hypothetical protein
MRERTASSTHATLLLLMCVYCAASLLHFIHNAVYLHDYPNLPAFLTSDDVYLAWLGITTIGAVGYGLYRHGKRNIGLVIIGVYALFGFGGLDHYLVAPIAAHTLVMNTTILIEVTTAAALLIFVIRLSRVS